ncbi:hypothetical protein HYPSUDRAFT_209006 [Hypholoma sublateritium FD-334 SS-4]|uniref:Uncharacterized protein n=1 Tax=Hypholoma sublateritium (strain FD-334 SS-4) TaxID=945553 RepID=A0A0D2KHL8_HYPSF|nr:hypothetical protein HYPSUDRAFT_209006 [Hypholoma sublateritium FD-334 SS-4]
MAHYSLRGPWAARGSRLNSARVSTPTRRRRSTAATSAHAETAGGIHLPLPLSLLTYTATPMPSATDQPRTESLLMSPAAPLCRNLAADRRRGDNPDRTSPRAPPRPPTPTVASVAPSSS